MSFKQHQALAAKCAEIGRMLGGMMKKTESFLPPE
jgi:ribosomal protein L34E